MDSGGGGNGAPAPIEIPIKSPYPLNEFCISSLIPDGEGTTMMVVPLMLVVIPMAKEMEKLYRGVRVVVQTVWQSREIPQTQRAEVNTSTEMFPNKSVKLRRGGTRRWYRRGEKS